MYNVNDIMSETTKSVNVVSLFGWRVAAVTRMIVAAAVYRFRLLKNICCGG